MARLPCRRQRPRPRRHRRPRRGDAARARRGRHRQARAPQRAGRRLVRRSRACRGSAPSSRPRPCGTRWGCEPSPWPWTALADERRPGAALRAPSTARARPIADLAVVSRRTGRRGTPPRPPSPSCPAGCWPPTDLAPRRAPDQGRAPSPGGTRSSCSATCARRDRPWSTSTRASRLQPTAVTPTTAAWAAILPSWRAAFPPDHPDHFDGDDPTGDRASSMRLVDGSELGPLHRSTTLLLDDGGHAGRRDHGQRPQPGPAAGRPVDRRHLARSAPARHRRRARCCISHAKRLLAEDGYVCLGLAVTAGNPARATYQAQGFRTVTESQTVLLPG